MLMYEGSIENVLASGEYDCGDVVVLDYDELYDLVEQCKLLVGMRPGGILPAMVDVIERKSNRPLHPVLGGKSPYTGFLSLV